MKIHSHHQLNLRANQNSKLFVKYKITDNQSSLRLWSEFEDSYLCSNKIGFG